MPVSTRGTSASLPRTAVFVAPGTPVPVQLTGRFEVDAQGDLRAILSANGTDQYIMYFSDRAGRKDASNPGVRVNVKPLAANAKGIRKQQIGAYNYPEINYLTPSGKSYRAAR